MSKIFISYRRDDSENIVGRIFDHLTFHFGKKNIFKDVDSIPLGKDFRQIVDKSLQSCDVMLVVIGDKWLNLKNKAGIKRIEDKNDFVRIEIESALKRGIPIIPVLLDSTNIPNEKDLPEPLKELAFKNGLKVRPDPDFSNDISRLKRSLSFVVKPTKSSLLNFNANLIALIIAMVIIVTLLIYINTLTTNLQTNKESNTGVDYFKTYPYTLKEKDTIDSLSSRFEISKEALIIYNSHKDMNNLKVGEEINIPSTHWVGIDTDAY